MKTLAALALLAALPLAQTANPTSSGDLSVEIPGLKHFSVQALGVPPVRRSEPAVLAFEIDGDVWTVDLEPHSVRAEGFRLIEVRDGVRIERQAPPPATYRGVVHDSRGVRIEGAEVRASEGDHGWSVNVSLPGRDNVVVEPLVRLAPAPAAGSAGLHVVYRSREIVGDGIPRTCGVEGGLTPVGERAGDRRRPLPDGPIQHDPQDTDVPATAFLTGQEITEVAFDADVEYWQELGSDVDETMRDIENVVNNCEVAYERDVDITYEITSIVVRTGAVGSDPYVSTDPATLLNEHRGEWNTNFPSVRHDLTHLMTGKDMDGSTIGFAYIGVVCSGSSDAGLSQSNWSPFITQRTGLTAHEFGHNWNAQHCDGGADCHIMCSTIGGCDGIGPPPIFGPSSISTIVSHRNSRSCLTDEPDILGAPFFDAFPTTTIESDHWVFNDQVAIRDDEGDAAPTEPGVLKLNAIGTDFGEQDDIRTHFIDLSGETQGTLSLSFFTQHQGVENGESLLIEYRNANNRRWKDIVTVTSDGMDQTDFTFHTAPLPNNAYHDRFRVRFHTDSDETDDDWFVDNVFVSDGPNLAQEPLVLGQPFDTVAHGAGAGELVVFGVSFAATTGTGASLFGGAVTLNILPPLAILGFDVADGSGRAEILGVPMPTNFPLLPVHTQAINLRGAGNTDSTKSNTVTHVVQ